MCLRLPFSDLLYCSFNITCALWTLVVPELLWLVILLRCSKLSFIIYFGARRKSKSYVIRTHGLCKYDLSMDWMVLTIPTQSPILALFIGNRNKYSTVSFQYGLRRCDITFLMTLTTLNFWLHFLTGSHSSLRCSKKWRKFGRWEVTISYEIFS